jgi:hypothetical protein
MLNEDEKTDPTKRPFFKTLCSSNKGGVNNIYLSHQYPQLHSLNETYIYCTIDNVVCDR